MQELMPEPGLEVLVIFVTCNHVPVVLLLVHLQGKGQHFANDPWGVETACCEQTTSNPISFDLGVSCTFPSKYSSGFT